MSDDIVRWRKTPKFILRQACIDDVTRDWPPGSFVEPGAGTGTLTRGFLDRGFHGAVHDLTEETRNLLRTNLAGYGDRVQVVDSLGKLEPESADYLFSFEVLEHVPDDASALAEWARTLRRGGRLLVSTPAHQRKYGSADALVGHVRRYEKDRLTELLCGAGFMQVRVFNYGFPIGNLTRIAQTTYDRVVRKAEIRSATPYEARSVESGVRTDRSVNTLGKLLNQRTLKPALAVQRRYYERERGDGWVATAVKA
jgi:SAM-dependent methyltransferase